jgi:predicted transcriptional regulator
LKNRSRVLTFMEILGALREGPLLPTRLSQLCNVNYERLGELTVHLESRGLIKKATLDGREGFAITPDGFRVLEDWGRVWERLSID